MIFIAKLILKAPYYKRGHKTEDGRGRGGYAEYIATREGVELLRGGMVNYIGQRKGSCGLFSDEGVSVDLAGDRQPFGQCVGIDLLLEARGCRTARL